MAYTSNDFWAQHDAMAAANAPKTNNTGIIGAVKQTPITNAPTTNTAKIGTGGTTLPSTSQQMGGAAKPYTSNDFWAQHDAMAAASGNTTTIPNSLAGYAGNLQPSSAGTTSGTGGITSNTYGNLNAYPQSSQQAITQQVTPQSTVSGQLDSLLSANSPYLEQARIAAQQQAAGRGLLNSSMAAGAGEAAAIQSALPIATQDANTYFTQAQANQNAQNQFGLNQQSSDLNADLARLNTSLNTDSATRLARLNNDLQMQQNNQNFGFQTQLQQQQFGNNRILQNDQFNQNVQLQNNQTENTGKLNNQTYQQSLQSGYLNTVSQNNTNATNDINTILQTPGLTPEQQQSAITTREQQRDNDNQAAYALYSVAPGWTSDWNTFG